MYSLKYTRRFKKNLKIYQHDNVILGELNKVLDLLIKGEELPLKNYNHRLIGEFRDCFECHIKPDILLVYQVEKSEITIILLRIGSHSKLF